ncbi:ATP-binding cassette domain-containing protein [uncultured Desulfovibrio sp.]|uniref:ATP-binding cassette domain-containing protein n=1 Tax=uncultured Desulfovibrio sp. TaxID=167968 RepID=UPI00260C79A0|nr:ATP-binding cassette domain-containing protein [uncultured Desulfovibrio sp.]
MTTEEPLVAIEHLNLFLPGDAAHEDVLHDICWTIRRGEHCALMGVNGAGKTTLLSLLHGLLWPSAGSIHWYGPDGPESSPIVGRSISALVSPAQQERYQRQRWYITGRELLLTGFEDTPLLYTTTTEEQEQAVRDMARRLDALPLLDRRLPEMSQGQLRILLLGRALLRRPALLLLDECVDGLDMEHRRSFFATLEAMTRAAGPAMTVIMSSHRMDQVPDWCSRRRWIDGGRLLPEGATPPFDAGAAALPSASPRPALHAAPASPALNAPPLVRVRHATVFIDGEEVLHDVNWTLRQGEHWRIVGNNGSGKSTFLRMLAGDEFVATGGSITRCLPGNGGETSLLEDIRKGIRLVSDLSQAQYGYDLNALGLVCSGFDNSVGIYRDFSAGEVAEAMRVMEELDAAELADISIRHVSTGQLRRLFLARALVGHPDVLLLDEPCSGLDPLGRAHYLSLLDKLAARGLHLVYVSHEEGEGPSCLNRQARMEHGRLRCAS